jgi:glucose-1-phosphate thymidylyltransferase
MVSGSPSRLVELLAKNTGEQTVVKGIVLAGGSGSRLYPLSLATSKQLMPVYDKPMIYYPISTLMLAGIRDILIITTPEHQLDFKRLLGTGESWGVNFSYEVQESPRGLPEALIIGEEFLAAESCALILGDNLFYGMGLGESLREKASKLSGARIFCQEVKDPQRYGIVQLDSAGKVLSIEEKPESPKSNMAATGLYFFDSSAPEYARSLKPSSRNELEISDLIKIYMEKDQLTAEVWERGAVWLDTGTFDSLSSASEFVRVIQERQSLRIGSPEEIAWRMGLISKEQLQALATSLPSSDYSRYLIEILSRKERS